jgi:hypothetical protein
MIYKNIPVDEETYQLLIKICERYGRKQGAQMKQLLKAEWERIERADQLPPRNTGEPSQTVQTVKS